jgi:hypothetical protein
MTTIAQFLHRIAHDHELRDKFHASPDDVFEHLERNEELSLNDRQKQVLRGGRVSEVQYCVEHETGVTNSPMETAKTYVTWVVPR